MLEDVVHWELSGIGTFPRLSDSRSALYQCSRLCISCLKPDGCCYLLCQVSPAETLYQGRHGSSLKKKRYSQNMSIYIILTYSRSMSSCEWWIRQECQDWGQVKSWLLRSIGFELCLHLPSSECQSTSQKPYSSNPTSTHCRWECGDVRHETATQWCDLWSPVIYTL